MKLVALNLKYFIIPWNVFDFIIVIASILGMPFFFYSFLLKILFLFRTNIRRNYGKFVC